MIMKKINVLVFCLFISASMSAQILTPSKWNYELSKKNIKQGDIVELVFKIELDATWYLYSNIQNYDIGPLPTSFEFENNNTYQLIDNVVPVGTIKEYNDVFEVNVNYFEHSAEFRQKIKILSKNPVIKGYYEYQVCSTVNGKCILAEDDFDIALKL